MTSAQVPAPIQISDDMREAINGALIAGNPVIVAYVDEAGQPNLSFRGSTQVYSSDQLAIWVRNPEGGLQRALAHNPRLTLLYRNPETRMMLNFQGRGHFDGSDAVRNTVYEHAPQPEQNADRERKGMALIIDLDRVNGFVPGGRVQMQRQ
ncbi:MAG TPA: pyridoxamine 5'-phosphate oxidase family protein [Dehalococcoidia bacterium]|nr:pyridoxamine 5'-phosphate oxidase family protein [Dehalococcoidia bacterium]